MNNVNMGGMGNPMGGPVGGGLPMMNNGMAGGQPRTTQDTQKFRALLNTYIYDYFITNEMGDCARALINSKQPLNLNESKGSRDENGNVLNNGVTDDNGDEMKVDLDSKRLGDLPAPQLPDKANSDSNFLYDWWCLFWEMYAAQRGETGQRGSIKPYLSFTQQARQKSEQQANALRQMRPDINPAYQQMLQMRNQQNGMMSNDIARKAMANSRNPTPQQQLQMLKQQQQMQRDGSDMDGTRRPQSPNGSENAPSPSKRPKLEGAPFNGQQGMMPNGRGQTQGMIPGQQVGPGPGSANLQAQMLQLGVSPQSLTPQQFQVLQAAQANKGGVQAYAQSLAQHQQKQMPVNGMPNGALPQGQGSPMMSQGGDGIYDQYNANGMGPNGMPRGAAGQAGAGGNHALQDYQMQLMLLEQQNKKRLMMARQEQDTFTGGREGSVPVAGVQGPNGQPMQGTSPQAPRPGVSPNPNDMKRGTPQMGNAGIPSPGDQARNSPANMNFIQGQMEPNMNPAFYNQMKGMEGGMVPGGMPNGMRPPIAQSGFGNQMNAHQMAIARQQQQQQHQQQQQQQAAQAAASQMPGWQGPNGAPMMNQPSQQGQQQPGQQQGQPGQQGVPTPQPQQRAMLPPSAPVAAANGNARTQPSSPQQPPAPPTPSQANKANPKAKKDNKERKKPAKKGGATAATGATPSAETAAEPATPTPATPIIPVHPASFNKNQNGAAAQQPTTNGQAPAPAPAPVIAAPPQQDTTQQPSFLDDSAMFGMPMGFDNASMGNTDVLQDFDFDSFLHQDGDNGDAFAFDPSGFNMEGGEIGAE